MRSMIRKNSGKLIGTLWLQGHLKRGRRRGRREAESKGGTVSFYQDNEAKEEEVKECSSNVRKSLSKSKEAGAPRQGVARTSPQPLSPSRAALRSNN